MKKILVLFILMLLFASCGEEQGEKVAEKVKKDFFIETVNLGEYSGENYISKVGRIRGSQDIMLSSQASGRVVSIEVKAGDEVYAGQVLARLSDNISNYEINLQRASIGVERARINYDSTKLNLDKQIFDAQQAVNSLERNLATLRIDAEKNIQLSQDAVDNAQYSNLDSRAALQLEQLDNNIAKSRLDYETKLAADKQQIESYKANIKREFTTTRTVLQDVIDLADSILGVSDVNKNKNDAFENFLGARDKNQKNIAEFELKKLIDLSESQQYEDTIELVSNNIDESDIGELIEITEEIYQSMISVLIELETTLNNSIESVGSLSSSEISGYISQTNALQSQIQGSYAGFISISSQTETFLSTYKKNQESILKSIELQEKDREITLKNLNSSELSAEIGLDRTLLSTEDRIQDLETQLESARNTLENAQKNKTVTLRSLENAISDAQVGYASALKEYNKLVITSPISGSVGAVMLDIGQEIFSGTSAFSLVSDGNPELEISLSFQEKTMLQEGQEVIIETANDKKITGLIYAISDVADENLNFLSTIIFDGAQDIIGTLVDVRIPVQEIPMSLPINAIQTAGDDIGFVQVFSGGTLQEVRVRMGDIMGENVQIMSCARNCVNLEVVVTNTTTFNENDFILKKR